MYQTIDIPESERALLFRKGTFVRVLMPGTHWIRPTSARGLGLGVHELWRDDIGNPAFEHPRAAFLVKMHPELAETHLHVFDLGDHEVGLVYVDGKLARMIPPATCAIYWRNRRIATRVAGCLRCSTPCWIHFPVT